MLRLRAAQRLALFFVVPLISGIAPLAMLPAVSRQYGADGWAAVAIALSVGGAAAIIGELGWGVIGPQRIARNEAERERAWRSALASRLVACAVLAPTAALVTALVTVEHWDSAALLACATTLTALSPSWFFTGVGRPGALLICETLPRVTITLASAGAIAAGGDLMLMGGGALLAVVATFFLAPCVTRMPLVPSRLDFGTAREVLRAQRSIVLGRALKAVSSSLPATLLGIVAPGAVAAYAGTDRPLRLGLSILVAVPQWLQRWIGHGDPAVRAGRRSLSLAVNVITGLIGGLVFALAAPTVVRVLLSGVIDIGWPLACTGGAIVATTCVTRGLGLLLVSLDRAHDITVAFAWSAAVTVVAAPLGGLWAGAVGAAAGILAAEAMGVAIQACRLRAALRAEQRIVRSHAGAHA